MGPHFSSHIVKLFALFSMFTGSWAWWVRDKTVVDKKPISIHLINGRIQQVSVLFIHSASNQRLVFTILPGKMIGPEVNQSTQQRCGICWEESLQKIRYHSVTLMVNTAFVASKYIKIIYQNYLNDSGDDVYEYIEWKIENSGMSLHDFEAGGDDLMYEWDVENGRRYSGLSCEDYLKHHAQL